MYSQKLSSTNFLILSLLALYSINEASALRCYKCVSASDESCSSPSSDYIVECGTSNSLPSLNTNIKSVNLTVQGLDSLMDKNNMVGATFDCGKFTGTGNGEALVARYCLMKSVSCGSYIDALKKVGFIVDTCDRCDTDACNSSSNLTVGFWTLCVSLIMIMTFKY